MTGTPPTEADLQRLITEEIPEGRTIEYKQKVGSQDADKKEFLADVTSLANTLGGALYVGIREKNGIPLEIMGLPPDQADAEIQRLENLLMTGVDPRIPGFHIDQVKTTQGVVLALSIPRSWAGPHMVTLKGTSRFFARNSNGKYQLDQPQIRELFVGSEARAERLRRFRLDRLAYIAGGESVLGRLAHGAIIVHLLPFQMLDVSVTSSSVDFDLAVKQRPRPINASTAGFRYNFDGAVSYDTGKTSYVQIFRSGALEAADSALLQLRKLTIPSTAFEEQTGLLVGEALKCQQASGVVPPVYVCLSLLNVRGYYFATREQNALIHLLERPIIDSSELLIPEITAASFDVDPYSLLRPAFDLVWSAAGFPRSQNYDQAGKWKPPQT
jgi:hypothetical protein